MHQAASTEDVDEVEDFLVRHGDVLKALIDREICIKDTGGKLASKIRAAFAKEQARKAIRAFNKRVRNFP
jgi:hypothetical protein